MTSRLVLVTIAVIADIDADGDKLEITLQIR